MSEPFEGGYTPRRGPWKGQSFTDEAEYKRFAAEERAAGRGLTAPRGETPDETPDGLKLEKPKSIKRDLGLLIGGLNDLIRAVPPLAPDALTQEEAEQLVTGLDKAQMGDPKFARLLRRAARGSGYGALILALIAIALPRLARHGLLPGFRREATPAEQFAAQVWGQQNPQRPPTPAEWAELVARSQQELNARAARAAAMNGAAEMAGVT